MRALLVEQFGGCDVLEVAEVDPPQVGVGQVLITVEMAAVNPVDAVTRAGSLHEAGLHEGAPVRLGWDVYGHVAAVGAGVRRLSVGQAVIGLSDRLAAPSKTQAELVVLDETAVAAAPTELNPQIAATLPLAGSTAWQALERLHLQPGQSVLVTGAAGSVGALAVQLAVLRGLRVVAAGRAGDSEYLGDLGAQYVVEIGPGLGRRVRDLVPGGVDAALDAAGIGSPSLDAVRNGGAHVSLNVTERPPPLRSVRSESVAVTADWLQLTVLAALAASGAITARIERELALSDVRAAHGMLAAGGLRGRIILRP